MTEVPLVVYSEVGERTVIGKAEVEPDGDALKARMSIDSPEIAAIFHNHVLNGTFSIGPFQVE